MLLRLKTFTETKYKLAAKACKSLSSPNPPFCKPIRCFGVLCMCFISQVRKKDPERVVKSINVTALSREFRDKNEKLF